LAVGIHEDVLSLTMMPKSIQLVTQNMSGKKFKIRKKNPTQNEREKKKFKAHIDVVDEAPRKL
jgi:hypothetical protein